MKEAKLGESIFKAYDVRGIYPKDLDETTAEALGCSFGEYIGRGKRIALGRDVRLSGGSSVSCAKHCLLLNIADV